MTHHELAHVLLAGVISFASWLILAGIGLPIAKLMEWTEDFERKYPNPVLYFFARIQGWTYDPERMDPYRRKGLNGGTDSNDGERFVLQGMIVAPLLGVLATAAYYQVAIGVAVGVATLSLFTLRFVKRLQKKFDLHAAEKNAHK